VLSYQSTVHNPTLYPTYPVQCSQGLFSGILSQILLALRHKLFLAKQSISSHKCSTALAELCLDFVQDIGLETTGELQEHLGENTHRLVNH
jgi:hypothetical protein